MNSFARAADEGNLLTLHPTVKPVALVADAIMDCSAPADIVLGGFLGSGRTVVAAERTGRRDDVRLSVDSDGVVRYTQRFSATVSSRFMLRRFPFDSRVLLIVFHPFLSDAAVVSFVPDLSHTRTATSFRTYNYSLASSHVDSLQTRIGPCDHVRRRRAARPALRTPRHAALRILSLEGFPAAHTAGSAVVGDFLGRTFELPSPSRVSNGERPEMRPYRKPQF